MSNKLIALEIGDWRQISEPIDPPAPL